VSGDPGCRSNNAEERNRDQCQPYDPAILWKKQEQRQEKEKIVGLVMTFGQSHVVTIRIREELPRTERATLLTMAFSLGHPRVNLIERLWNFPAALVQVRFHFMLVVGIEEASTRSTVFRHFTRNERVYGVPEEEIVLHHPG